MLGSHRHYRALLADEADKRGLDILAYRRFEQRRQNAHPFTVMSVCAAHGKGMILG